MTFERLRALGLAIAPELSSDGLTLLRHEARWPLPGGGAYCYREFEGHKNVIVFAIGPTDWLCIHELGHLLPLDKFDLEDSGYPWDRHGPQFIRRVIHLCHRAALHGHGIDPGYMACGGHYGLSPAADYVAALADEPARMLCDSFADIDAAPLPRPFAELFASDVAKFKKEFPSCACS